MICFLENIFLEIFFFIPNNPKDNTNNESCMLNLFF